MKRRFMPSIPTSPTWDGAFATKWEGFSKAWVREYYLDRGLRPWKRRQIRAGRRGLTGVEHLGKVCGVYVFLTRNNYVLYAGKSKNLQREVKLRYQSFKGYKRKHISAVVAHQALNEQLALKMESDLQRYYAPPWNTKFGR